MRILVVDDSKTTRLVIMKTLRHLDPPMEDVLQAENGIQALGLLESENVDLVLTDINMPEMNGVELIQRMASIPSMAAIPVVVISTEGSQTRISELEELGVANYLRKPFKPEDMLAAIAELNYSDSSEERPCEDDPSKNDYIADASKILCETLESMSFVFATPVRREEATMPRGECYLAGMSFSGPKDGELKVAIPQDLCPEIAANILGVEDDDELAIEGARDAVGEVLNVICGQMLTRVFGEDSVFDLSIPVVGSPSLVEWIDVASGDGTQAFDVDNQPILLKVVVAD